MVLVLVPALRGLPQLRGQLSFACSSFGPHSRGRGRRLALAGPERLPELGPAMACQSRGREGSLLPPLPHSAPLIPLSSSLIPPPLIPLSSSPLCKGREGRRAEARGGVRALCVMLAGGWSGSGKGPALSCLGFPLHVSRRGERGANLALENFERIREHLAP